MSTGIDWATRARKVAKSCHKTCPDVRWDMDLFIAEDAFYIFNNYPYRDRLTRRDKQLEEFRARMPHLGVSELAYAEYPETGSEEGYTYTLLIAGTPEQAKAAKESYREVINSFGWDEVDQIDSESSDDISEEEQE